MIRVTIELLPGGNEARARTIGLVEICNIGGTAELGEYAVVLKKTPPFAGALSQAWRRGRLIAGDVNIDGVESGEDDDLIVARVGGHHRTLRGSYDLLYRALRACGLAARNPDEAKSQ